jgi:hypothetical protein
MELWGFIATVVGLAVGVIGVAVAVSQGRRATRLSTVTQQGLMEAISQLSPLLMSNEQTQSLATSDGELVASHYAVLERHRLGLTDLYRRLIHQYLAGEKRFTFERLTSATVDGIIHGGEAVDVWRQAISQRKENQTIDNRKRAKSPNSATAPNAVPSARAQRQR